MEGFVQVVGGKIWYKIIGEKRANPLVILHGGPGFPHDYLEPLEKLSNKREVIFYDQLGCGNSEKPHDLTLWTVDRFVTELREVIKNLGLKKYHILGQSWGSALAVAFAQTEPKGLISLILSDPYISTPQWEKDAKKLLQQLPKDMQKALEGSNADSEEYKKASNEFYYRFVNRLNPLPTAVIKSNNKINLDIYRHMWGYEEFKITGTLKDFDPSDKLSVIGVPVLLLCGRFDEATPEALIYFANLFPNVQTKVFEKSAHFPFWNQKEEYLETVQNFLHQAES